MILKKIKKHLKNKIKIDFIKIYDDSPLHNYSKTGLTHLRLIIISNDFTNQKLINRHRIIFSMLSEIIKEKIYSVTLNAYTSIEWKNKTHKTINATKCFNKKNILLDY